jgi:cytochrome c-type biogenesis protein CcmH
MHNLAPPEAPSAPPPRGHRQRTGRAGSAAVAGLGPAVRRALAGLALLVLGASAVAAPAQPTAADPELEARVMAIAVELRCLVCQNQTIADSHAGLAIDLRNQVREMLRQGKTRDDVIAYMTARYGDFVLYRPPLKESTALLWLGPALLFAAGMGLLAVMLRKRARAGDDQFEPDPEPEANDHRG